MTESMENIVRKKPLGNVIWKFFILSNAFTFFAFLMPYVYASYSILTLNIWMWGAASFDIAGYGSIPAYFRDPFIRLFYAIGSLISLLSILGLFILGGYLKNHMDLFRKTKYLFIVISGIIIVVAIVLVIPLQNQVNFILEGIEDPPFEEFWQFFNPGLGMVGTILGASITLIITGYTWRNYDSIIEAMKSQEMSEDMDEIPIKTRSSSHI